METYLHIQLVMTGPRLVNYTWNYMRERNLLNLQGHEHYNPQKKNYIFLRQVAEEMKAKSKKR